MNLTNQINIAWKYSGFQDEFKEILSLLWEELYFNHEVIP